MSIGDRSTVEDVLAGFEEHLRRTRGVCPGTRRNYARFVRASCRRCSLMARWRSRISACATWSTSSQRRRAATRRPG
jgi:hypothetical protein